MAYYRLEPRGAAREDERAALLATLTANIHRDRKQKPYKTEEFRISALYRRRKPQSVEQMLEQATAIVSALGGEIE